MSRKKRSRKEEKRQRREQMRRMRRRAGIEDPFEQPFRFDLDLSAAGPAVLKDIRGLFAATETSPPAFLTSVLIHSSDLSEERELRDVVADPMLTLRHFFTVVEEFGMEAEEATSDDFRFIVAEMSPYVVREDESLRGELVTGLRQMRRRFREEGNDFGAGRAALAQLVLEQGDEVGWRSVGLLQAIGNRSLEAAFAMIEVAETMEEVRASGEGLTEEEVFEEIIARVEGMLRSRPGLDALGERQMARNWAAGIEALLDRELALPLFSAQEVEGALAIFRENVTVEENTISPHEGMISGPFRTYTRELLSEERLQQLHADVAAAAAEESLAEWRTFLLLAVAMLEGEEFREGVSTSALNFCIMTLLAQTTEAFEQELEAEEEE